MDSSPEIPQKSALFNQERKKRKIFPCWNPRRAYMDEEGGGIPLAQKGNRFLVVFGMLTLFKGGGNFQR
jgi:hypothetical protein